MTGPEGEQGIQGETGSLVGPENTLTMWFSVFPDQSTSPDTFEFVGINSIAKNGNTDLINQTTGISGSIGIGNNHVGIQVNSLGGTGTVIITGSSLSETTAIPVIGSSETLMVDATGLYQTSKKWIEITDVNIISISNINYDVSILGYMDIGNRNFVVDGYRLEALAGSKSEIEFIINKVQDNGNGKTSIVPLEDIKINTTINNSIPRNSIYDILRLNDSTYDRSYTMVSGNIWSDGTVYVFKQDDFTDYFNVKDPGRNIILSRDKDEGLIIRVNGTIGSPNGTPYMRLQVRYYFI